MRHDSVITIDARSLKKGVYHFEFSPSAESIELDADRFRAIDVACTVSVASSGTVVSLTASAVATLECDRLLVDFDQDISGSFEGVAVSVTPKVADFSDELDQRARGVDDQDMEVSEADLAENVPMHEGIIVLDAVVRDTLLLAVPMRKISPEADTMELATEFGKDDSEIDPRWEGLRRLGEQTGKTTGKTTEQERRRDADMG